MKSDFYHSQNISPQAGGSELPVFIQCGVFLCNSLLKKPPYFVFKRLKSFEESNTLHLFKIENSLLLSSHTEFDKNVLIVHHKIYIFF